MKWLLPTCMAILGGLSLLILRSIAPGVATLQLFFLILAGVIFFATPWYGLQRWLKIAPLLYVALIVLLIIPLVTGTTTRGITGWINVGTLFSIQPSQLAIPTVVLMLISRLQKFDGKDLRVLLEILAIIALPAGLIIIEPDLGTTVIYVAALGAVLWISKLDLRYILGLIGIGTVLGLVAWLFFLKPYQKERIYSFANPQASQDASSYNARQALIAVGSGEVTGRGLGEGIQSHLRFLPERQTDFIFASFAEEVGFLGSVLVIMVYMTMIAACLWIGEHSTHPAGRSIAVATAVMLTVQSGINIGMNMGLLPITGITLPFLSYGGSSIVAISWLLGLVQSLRYFYRQTESIFLS